MLPHASCSLSHRRGWQGKDAKCNGWTNGLISLQAWLDTHFHTHSFSGIKSIHQCTGTRGLCRAVRGHLRCAKPVKLGCCSLWQTVSDQWITCLLLQLSPDLLVDPGQVDCQSFVTGRVGTRLVDILLPASAVCEEVHMGVVHSFHLPRLVVSMVILSKPM